MLPIPGPHPWSDVEAMKKAARSAFKKNLEQLMLQSLCSWSAFPTQELLYLKLLTGPFFTVIKFLRPPGVLPGPPPADQTMDQVRSGHPMKRRRVDEVDAALPPLNKLITREYAPQLVVWNHHIFSDSCDPTQGLSAAFRYTLSLTTENIVKQFDQGLLVEQSRIFNFSEFAECQFEETNQAQVRRLLFRYLGMYVKGLAVKFQ